VLNSVNQPDRATSSPALAVPGTAEFSCAAIRTDVDVCLARNKRVDCCRRVRVASALGATARFESATRSSLSMIARAMQSFCNSILYEGNSVRSGFVLSESRNQLRLMTKEVDLKGMLNATRNLSCWASNQDKVAPAITHHLSEYYIGTKQDAVHGNAIASSSAENFASSCVLTGRSTAALLATSPAGRTVPGCQHRHSQQNTEKCRYFCDLLSHVSSSSTQ